MRVEIQHGCQHDLSILPIYPENYQRLIEMKLRAVLNKRREVLELLGDEITLRHCREAVHRKFGLR